MPSTYKTEHLGLNNFIGTDKPKRTDFNSDNALIDTAVYEHTANNEVHVTAEEKQLWNAPFVIGSYTGDNTGSRTIPLSFTPRAIFVTAAGYSPIAVSESVEVFVRSGLATALGCTKGIELTENGFVVQNVLNMPPDGESAKLNMNAVVYIYLALK